MPTLDPTVEIALPSGDRYSQHSTAAQHLPGLLVCGLIAVASIALGKLSWMQSHGLSALTIAIMLGIAVGNIATPLLSKSGDAGVMFSKQSLLRAGIVLYGFRVTFQDVAQVGVTGVAIDAIVLTSTFALALVVGRKVLKLDRETSILIGAGSAICGAAAVMATAPVVRARAEQVTVAVSTVVVFGTLGIFLYPMLFELNLQSHLLGDSSAQFGVYIGSTVHEVAQVVAAGRSIDPDAANAAVVAKMVRVMMLAPFLLAVSAWCRRDRQSAASSSALDSSKGQLAIPWFAFIFIAVVGLHSIAVLPAALVSTITNIDTILLAMAMAALSLTTHAAAIRRAGIKPLILAALLFCWLVAGGAVINRSVMMAFH